MKHNQKIIKNKYVCKNMESQEDLNISDDNIIYYINIFKQKGVDVLSNIPEDILIHMIQLADDIYYNDNDCSVIITDYEYDIMREYIKSKFPKNVYFKKIGFAPITEKVKLPVFIGSMDKIKPNTNTLKMWDKKYKGPYVVSAKVDGVSGLYVKENGKETLFTRGDGEYGKDVSKLIPHLYFPEIEEDIIVRGEFMIRQETFHQKYEDDYCNSRNLVSGIINRKIIDKKIEDVQFIAYELISPVLKPSEQFLFLSKHNFKVIEYSIFTTINNDILKNYLINLKENYYYTIDGIIITDDHIYERKIGNPDQSFAYKIQTEQQITEATVVDVIWSPSKNGYLKPRIKINTVTIDNVSITFINGFNGSYIKNNKIGIGSVIRIIRSGDVIPHILDVITPVDEPKMPEVNYTWSSSGVDIILEDIDNDKTVRLKQNILFFKTIGVEELCQGHIKQIMDSGNDTIEKIINMELDDFLLINGFQQKMASKIYNNIHENINTTNIENIIVGSNIFARGTSIQKVKLIFELYPDILENNISDSEKIINLTKIKGISQNSARQFVEKIPEFLSFLNKIINVETKNKLLNRNFVSCNHPLYKKTIVITGFRNSELIDKIEKVGCIISNNVNNKTTMVISKNIMLINNKMKEAQKFNVPILTINDFINIYFKEEINKENK
jgi:NAD-dependent DNA ligase